MRRLAIAAAVTAVVAAAGATAAVVAWRDAGEARVAAAPHGQTGVRSFRLVLRGEECAGISALCLTRKLPAEGVLVVDQRADGSVVHERRFSDDHVEAQTFAAGADGLVLEEQRQEVSFAGMRRDEQDVPSPEPLLFPAALAVGDRWEARYMLRKLAVHTTSAVVASEDVEVDGQKVATLVIDQTTTSSGPFSGDERVRLWWAPALRLAVRRTVERRLEGGFAYRLQLDERLASTTPIG